MMTVSTNTKFRVDIDNINSKVLEATKKELELAIDEVVPLARMEVPVDTGYLRESIYAYHYNSINGSVSELVIGAPYATVVAMDQANKGDEDYLTSILKITMDSLNRHGLGDNSGLQQTSSWEYLKIK